jgi:hypothetical protein
LCSGLGCERGERRAAHLKGPRLEVWEDGARSMPRAATRRPRQRAARNWRRSLFHSITSSASSRIKLGTVRPS